MENITIMQDWQISEAVFWFVPIIAWALLGAVGGVIIGHIIGSIWDSGKKIGMAVLGMKQSGKTTWYNHLTGDNRAGQTFDSVDIKEIFLKFPDGKEARIKEGKDIGGDEGNVREYYEEMIDNNEVVLFFFSAYDYLYDNDYRRLVNGRLDYIKRHLGDKRLYYIMTYADKIPDRDGALNKILDMLKKEDLFKMQKGYFLVNATDKKELNDLTTTIFK